MKAGAAQTHDRGAWAGAMRRVVRGPALFAVKGFCMGAADVVPGVSGGTMAFILGIYQRLLEAIRSFDLRLLALLWRADLKGAVRHVDLIFLLPLVVGIFSALMFFTRVVPLPVYIHTHPELVYGLFFGLIVASVVVLMGEVERRSAPEYVFLILGVGAGLAVANLVPMATPETMSFVFLSGMLAITAMILPGISGSFVLLILRKYAYVFDALGRLDLSVLIPFALGAASGLILFSRTLVWLLHHYYRQTLVSIIGILVGSLWMIWPFQERVYETVRHKARLVSATPTLPGALDGTFWASVMMVVTGFALVMVIHWLSRHHRAASR